MECDYYDAGECSSCTLMGTPHPRQIDNLDSRVRRVLQSHVDESAWLSTAFAAESGFRNRAKLAVGGSRGELTFGILDSDKHGVDLRRCGLYEQGLSEALGTLCPAVSELGLTPYDVNTRSGEFKNLVVTHAPTGDLMVRFVLRSPGQLRRVREGLRTLHHALPSIAVASVNLHPEHKAVLSGPEEIILTGQDMLRMPVGDVPMFLRPEAFFQTNTAVAESLYAQASSWVAEAFPSGRARVWDLFCGAGGFGLNIGAHTPADVLGLEIEAGAIEGARRSAEIVQGRTTSSFDFRAGNALAALAGPAPDVLVVNPPRRGIGSLSEALESSGTPHLIYSSCNVLSLQRDLDRMPSYSVRAARTYDMFPQTEHHEVLLHLTR